MRAPASALRLLPFFVVAGMFAAAAVFYPSLPASIPSHWGLSGEPDQWMAKFYGVWFIPGLALLLLFLLSALPLVDPKKENYKEFGHAWNCIRLSIMLFLAYVFGVQMYASLYPEQSSIAGHCILFGVGALFMALGNYMGKVKQNYFVGLRTPWTLSDPEVWRKSQRAGGLAFVLGGCALMVLAFLPLRSAWLMIVVVAAVVVVPIAYSYVLYRRK